MARSACTGGTLFLPPQAPAVTGEELRCAAVFSTESGSLCFARLIGRAKKWVFAGDWQRLLPCQPEDTPPKGQPVPHSHHASHPGVRPWLELFTIVTAILMVHNNGQKLLITPYGGKLFVNAEEMHPTSGRKVSSFCLQKDAVPLVQCMLHSPPGSLAALVTVFSAGFLQMPCCFPGSWCHRVRLTPSSGLITMLNRKLTAAS